MILHGMGWDDMGWDGMRWGGMGWGGEPWLTSPHSRVVMPALLKQLLQALLAHGYN